MAQRCYLNLPSWTTQCTLVLFFLSIGIQRVLGWFLRDNSWITSAITSFTQLRKASKRSWALLLFIVSPVEIGAIHHHKADFSFLGVIWLLFWFTWLQVTSILARDPTRVPRLTSIDIRDFLKLPNSWQWLDCLFVFWSTLRNYENNNEWNVMDFWDSVIREPHIYGCKHLWDFLSCYHVLNPITSCDSLLVESCLISGLFGLLFSS
jgi:hypothetical protein